MTTTPLASVGLVLLVLFVILSWLTRRLEGGGSLRRRARGERVVLTPEHTVHVVEAGGVRLLVGTGPGSAPQVLAKLGEVEAPTTTHEVEPQSIWDRPAFGLLARAGVAGGH